MYACNAAGHRIRTELDGDDDGVVDEVRTFEVDDAGNPLITSGYDGTETVLEERIVQTFDADGRRTSRYRDQDGDGTDDERWDQSWRCVDEVPPSPMAD